MELVKEVGWSQFPNTPCSHARTLQSLNSWVPINQYQWLGGAPINISSISYGTIYFDQHQVQGQHWPCTICTLYPHSRLRPLWMFALYLALLQPLSLTQCQGIKEKKILKKK